MRDPQRAARMAETATFRTEGGRRVEVCAVETFPTVAVAWAIGICLAIGFVSWAVAAYYNGGW